MDLNGSCCNGWAFPNEISVHHDKLFACTCVLDFFEDMDRYEMLSLCWNETISFLSKSKYFSFSIRVTPSGIKALAELIAANSFQAVVNWNMRTCCVWLRGRPEPFSIKVVCSRNVALFSV